MHRIFRLKILPQLIIFVSLMRPFRVESEKGKAFNIDKCTWNEFAVLVHGDRSRIFKHQDVGSILVANNSIDDGLGGNGDDLLSTYRNWASCNMSSGGKTLEAALFPKLWMSSSTATLENFSFAVEIKDAYEIFKEYYFKR